jgi:hypothetical protein
MSYIIQDNLIKHDGGTHNLEVEIDHGQAVFRFGSSFTLRISEEEVWRLRDILHDTGCELEQKRFNP